MNTWHFYDLATGVLSGASYSGDEVGLAAQLAHKGAGVAAIAGVADYLSQRIDLATGSLVDYQPPAPSNTTEETFSWDAVAKRWVSAPTPAVVARGIRETRNQLLAQTDWTQGADSPLDAIEKAAWQAYRALLRGVPEQNSFPADVTWPTPPG